MSLKGENPFNALKKSLTTNAYSGNFKMEELAVLAGTMTSSGHSVGEVDTSINNFLANLNKAEQQFGVKLQGKSLTDVFKTLENLDFTGADELKSAFTLRGMKAPAIGLGNLQGLERDISMFEEANQNPEAFKNNAEIMNQSFESSEVAFNAMTTNFQANYGRVARGFHWMKNEAVANILQMVNGVATNGNILTSTLANIGILGFGSIGALTRSFIDLAPTVLAFTGVVQGWGDITSLFRQFGGVVFSIFKTFGTMLLSVIPAIWSMVVATSAWAVANWAMLGPWLLIGLGVAALVALVWKFKDSIVSAFKIAWDWVSKLAIKVWDFLNSFVVFRVIFRAYETIFSRLFGVISWGFQKILKLVSWVWDKMKSFGNWLKSWFVDVPEVKNADVKALSKEQEQELGSYDKQIAKLGGASGGGGGASKDEDIKARGWYAQAVNSSAVLNFKNQNKDFVSAVDINPSTFSSVDALKVVGVSVDEIKKFVKEMLDIMKEAKTDRKLGNNGLNSVGSSSLESELNFLYPD